LFFVPIDRAPGTALELIATEGVKMKRPIFASSVILFSAAGLLLVGQAPTLPGTSVDRIGFPEGLSDNVQAVVRVR
jgi:hypothetical protein